MKRDFIVTGFEVYTHDGVVVFRGKLGREVEVKKYVDELVFHKGALWLGV